MNLKREQASFVLKLCYQTQTPFILAQNTQKEYLGKETTQQATNSLNSEKICERGINRDAVFTYRLWH